MLLETKQSEHLLADDLCQTIGSICKYLKWDDYLFTLKSLIKLIPETPSHENQLVKAFCSVVSNFHFQSSDLAILEKV